MIGILCLYHTMFNYNTFVIFVQYSLCIIFVFVVFTSSYTHAHARTHTHEHYDILSDIMIILDHGNICVDTIFMILSCIVFQILKKLGFSIMAVLICIHVYAYS